MSTQVEVQVFQVQLDVQEITEDLENAIFEAGCSDTTLWSSEGLVFLNFHRPAVTMSAAVRSALEDLEVAGVPVSQILAPFSFAAAS
jgi:hypothetical protein